MSKSLRNISKQEQESAIVRRLAQAIRGLGYWAAIDARIAQAKKAKRISVLQFGQYEVVLAVDTIA